MEIKINGQTADIKIENEKTVGDVIVGLDNWLENSGHRLSGLIIDDKIIDASSMNEAFQKEIGAAGAIDILTSAYADLYETGLLSLLRDIGEYESLDFQNRKGFGADWNKRAQALFISEEAPDLFQLCEMTFTGQASAENLVRVTEERLREVRNPSQELSFMQPVIAGICSKLTSLPLDIQTGKDKLAAETIQAFTANTEKLFRLFRHLAVQGFIAENEFTAQIEQFGETVRELHDAYERNDCVLIGDMAEYEVAPKLEQLFNAFINGIKKTEAGHK